MVSSAELLVVGRDLNEASLRLHLSSDLPHSEGLSEIDTPVSFELSMTRWMDESLDSVGHAY